MIPENSKLYLKKLFSNRIDVDHLGQRARVLLLRVRVMRHRYAWMRHRRGPSKKLLHYARKYVMKASCHSFY